MSEKEMPKAYEAKETESKWYKYWEDNGLFHVQDIPEKLHTRS